MMSIPHELFSREKAKRKYVPTHFYEGGITVLPKTRQRHYKKTRDE